MNSVARSTKWVCLLALFGVSCGGRSGLELFSGPDQASVDAGETNPDVEAGPVEPDSGQDGAIGLDAPSCPPVSAVTASQGARDDGVELSWAAPREASSLELLRDGAVIATLSPFDTTYVDLDAGGTLETSPPTELVATQGTRSDGVWLTWTPAEVTAGPAHTYAIVTVCANGERASSPEVSGTVGAPALTYELSRDDGASWTPIDASSSFLDTEAPLAVLTAGSPTATPYFQLSSVALRTTAATASAAPSVTYRVRAQTSSGVVGETNPATGYRGVGWPSYQWQRSAGVADDAYSDLPDVTGTSWFDDTAPAGKTRFYRVVASAEGATPATSDGVSVVVPVRALMLAAGSSHTCGLGTDQKIRCWGDNTSGQTSAPTTQSFKAVAAGGTQSCGIGLDDKVVCWGSAGYPPNVSFKAIAMGGIHVCGIRTDDHVVCWGSNSAGQAPTTPSTDTFKAITAGYFHTCGIRMDGTLACWGFFDQTYAPAGTFKAISAGEQHTCAIRDDDKVLCWGTNQYGEMIAGPSTLSFKAIACGQDRTCGIRTDDKVVCWGNASTAASSGSFKAITAGDHHVCGIRADDSITCWGYNDSGQAPPPPAPDHYTAVAASTHTCAIRTDGRLLCWGGYEIDTPAMVSPDSFVSVTVGTQVCAIRDDDKVLCWGDNNLGQAPPGPSTDSFRKVAAAGDFTCGIRTDGKLVCWGNDHKGQIPAGPSAADYSDVSGGYAHLCAVRSDGKLLCWGDNSVEQAPPGPSTDSYRSVVASFNDTCALRTDDTAACWGMYLYNTPPVPPSDPFVELAAGANHTCGLRFDGHVVCWGYDNAGQLTNTPSTDTYVAIDADFFVTCGIRSDGRVICWGDDSAGEARSLLVVP